MVKFSWQIFSGGELVAAGSGYPNAHNALSAAHKVANNNDYLENREYSVHITMYSFGGMYGAPVSPKEYFAEEALA